MSGSVYECAHGGDFRGMVARGFGAEAREGYNEVDKVDVALTY